MKTTPKPPPHLSASTKLWFASVIADYELEPHHVRLLTKCAESWDLSEKARQAIEKEGMTYTDRFGSPRARPEVAIMRDAKISFCRILRDLDIDVSTPSESRPPALRSNRG